MPQVRPVAPVLEPLDVPPAEDVDVITRPVPDAREKREAHQRGVKRLISVAQRYRQERRDGVRELKRHEYHLGLDAARVEELVHLEEPQPATRPQRAPRHRQLIIPGEPPERRHELGVKFHSQSAMAHFVIRQLAP